ncbi:unnamed protein product [Peronospora belbahrii]|uniref:Uncharacterized protein n=1 Tax=Peronospora belbahrii TaxID=622444 RepID=A0ABN8CVR1_9STRA|nr:unnamed protein product [Peronospora belbahrii]
MPILAQLALLKRKWPLGIWALNMYQLQWSGWLKIRRRNEKQYSRKMPHCGARLQQRGLRRGSRGLKICRRGIIYDEAKFVAAPLVVSDMLGLRELLGEIGVRVAKPMLMHVGNEAAIKQIQGEDSAGRAKHIAAEIDRAVQVDLAGVKTSREDMLKGRNFSSEEVRLFM